MVGYAFWRGGLWELLAGSVHSLSVAGWSVIVAVSLFSLFALQAELPISRSRLWLLPVCVLALPPFLKRVSAGGFFSRHRSGLWLSLAAFVLWAGVTAAVPASPLASQVTFCQVAVACLLGFILFAGFRARLWENRAAAAVFLLLIWVSVAGLVILRSGGMNPLLFLEGVGWPSSNRPQVWTEKFSTHWLLVLSWSTLLASSSITQGRREIVGALSVGTALAILLDGSHNALGALLLSAVLGWASLRWPRPSRRALVAGTVSLLLLAPLLYRLPWQVQQHEPEAPGASAAWARIIDVRAGIWERSAQLAAVRPLAGWGIGASASGRMPEDKLMAEQREDGGAVVTGELRSNPTLPGGHPHSLPLLAWLDLGLIGVCLLTGFVLFVGRRIARYEALPPVHACLCALFMTTVSTFAVNYPAWHPTVLSILWLGPVVAGALLPVGKTPAIDTGTPPAKESPL